MEIVIQIAEKIVEYTFAPIGQWLCYSFHYNINMENLKNQEEPLRNAKNRVQHSVDAASRNGEEIEDDVKTWLTKVDQASSKLSEIEEAGTRSSNAACQNLKYRHHLSREAKKMVENIAQLLKTANFDRVSYRPASEGMETTRNMDYMAMESRKTAVNGIMEALRNADIDKIGVWGMPGVGKSTLMKEIARQAREEKLFNEVVMAVVTDSPDVKRIQGAIACTLGLNFDQETDEIGRASQLQRRLSKDEENKILVILDDIWKELDLVEIGITPSERCKIVLTSRNRDVLTCGMATQKDFALQTLLKKEAWDLFEKMAGHESLKDPNVRDIAIEVAEECAGLPIALVTVSKALKNKSLCEWKDALRQLRRLAPRHVTEMLKKVYSPIELSYKNLESQQLKSLLLLCAQLPTFFCYRDLLKYCYGYGLFHDDGIDTLEEARNMLDTQLRKLRDSCLLLESSNQFRMHDVVRDVATIIASNDRNMFVMRDDGGLKALPDADSLKRCETLSILGGDINQLPNKMECPQLRFLHVYFKDHSLQIPDTLFQGMDKLNVLDLTKMRLSPIPSSLLLLRNLQTLCLDHCVLGDIAGIGELKNLVILSLLRSDISKLPREIGLLLRLRLFDLSHCSKLEVIPPNVLSSLVELEELYMENSFVQWEAEGLITERSNNANLAELKNMLRLTTLEIHIRDACMLPRDLQFGELERYNILVGDVWDWSDKHECSRTLKLKLKTSFQSELGIKMLLNRTECLYLDELKGVKSVLHELDREGFQQLKHLHIQNNEEIKYIIISSPVHISTISFPALETCLLKNMTGLEDICHGQLHSTSFRNLRVVKVENCEKLKFVFPSSVARGFSQLQELQIRECSNICAIVMKEGGEIEDTDMIFFPRLRRLALEHLPKLMSFLRTKKSLGTEAGEIVSEGTLDFDMPILHEQVLFPNLEILELSSVDLEETQHNQHRARLSCRLTTMEAMSRFQNLSILEVQGSCNMKYLLSFSTARFMVQLKHLHISECKAMEEVLVTEEIAAAGEITKEVFRRLECLSLKDLPKLKRFCVGCNIQFPFLENLWIEHCPKLVTFIFNPASSGATTCHEIIQTNAEERSATAMQPLFNVEVAFPCLKKLAICRMDYLKHIWQNQFAESSFCNLQIVKVELCENLVSIFQSDMLTRFQSVEELFVIDCSSLQQVFELQELNVNENQAVTAIQLKVFLLERLPQMKHVWSKDPKAVFSFKNLTRIEASGCENLRSFFPASIATSLMQLEHLKIIDCGVEEIVEGEGREDAIERFVFPQVTFLTLQKLPRLKWFYPGVHTLECPKLKKMWVEGCHKIDIFAYGLLSFQETLRESRHVISTQQPLFLVDQDQVAFPSLEILIISHMDNLITIWHDQVAADSFCNIQDLMVEFCGSVLHVFDSNMPRRFKHLTGVCIRECASLEEVFEVAVQGRNSNVEAHTVTTTYLSQMYLVHLPRLKNVWNKDYPFICSFQNLHQICAEGCESLKSFFPAVSMAISLTQLEVLQIVNCGIEEIVTRGEEATPRFVFPRMTTLHLEGLAKLKWFYPGVHTSEWPLLKDMRVDGCQKVEIFASEYTSFQEALEESRQSNISNAQPLFLVDQDQVAFPCLKKLEIRRMDCLRLIWQNQFVEHSFGNLQIIKVELCEKLESIFQSDMLTRFQSVEVLFVAGCNSLQQVFELQELNVNENQAVTTIQLKELWLASLPKMKHVWSKDPKAVFSFKNLKRIQAGGCENLRSFFPASVARSLMELEYLEIMYSGVEEIVEGEGREDAIERFVFPQVTSLTLKGLPRLKWFYPGVGTLECPMLKEMWVEGCQNVDIFAYGLLSFQEMLRGSRHVIATQQPLFLVHEVAFPSLEKLVISHMDNLITIWHDHAAADSFCSFQNLHQINAEGCKSLKSFFPAVSVATSLTQLEDLRIVNCGIEEIVARGGEEVTPRFVFPKLTSLELGILPKLKWIFPGAHNLEWPVLKELKVWGCNQVSIFASKFSRFPETSQQCLLESSIQHPLLLVGEGTFPKLEALKVNVDHTTWSDQFLVEFFCKLKVLEVQCNHDKSVLSLSNLLKRLQNLEKLLVRCTSWEEIIPYEDFIGPEKHARIFPRLKELRVSKAPMLTHLWKEDVQESLVFDKVLEILAVSECHKLKSLVPSSTCFHNLTDLEILSCNGLINLITYTTAKSLVQLRKMRVSSCEGMAEIVAMGDDQAKVVITFSKLTCIKFDRLPNFTSFCSGSYSIMFPFLEEVIVEECPVMKTFCHGVLSTPKLKRVQATRGEKSHTQLKHDLNTTIHSLWEYFNTWGMEESAPLSLLFFRSPGTPLVMPSSWPIQVELNLQEVRRRLGYHDTTRVQIQNLENTLQKSDDIDDPAGSQE